ncbi:hypothetical protein JCM3775_000221 [Rhodotorula graminis]|uniref:Nuclear pore complex protein Nup85 n=1 Tax=Rhodotorula graminis (strain WP1) TaxID=578459 RepID=A0A0P9EK24_RHOGW|nr:uncharacterized protein RHOBADRAFT_54578 [Rhodotorula graminis WP1]KPV74003.1 hypothetical protein RHOBADRAFT_54578 [Rhodotorula graminis WP1]
MAPSASFSFGAPTASSSTSTPLNNHDRPHQPPLKESRTFITDTYTIWASLQRIVQQNNADQDDVYGPGGAPVPTPDQVQYYGRVSRLYREAIVQQLPLIQSDTDYTPAGKHKALAHFAAMHGVLALAEILFFPSDGVGEGLVAEELLDWVNTIDPAPSNDEGAELLALASPWDSDDFVPYLSRCVLRGHLSSAAALLSLVESQHPDETLQHLAKHLSTLVASYPRSTAFRTESAFVVALRQWRTQTLAPLKPQVDSLLSSSSDDWGSSLAPLVALVSSAASDPSSSSSSSAAESAIAALGPEDWRESLAAHCLWASPTTLRRADLPPLVDALTRTQPVDASLPAERAHAALLRGDVPGVLKALTGAHAWAAAHLGDLLAHLHLPAFDPPALTGAGEDDDALGLREAFLLDWGDRCTADPGLWRVSCEYWAACGTQGREKVRALAVALPLEVEGEGAQQGAGARAGAGAAGAGDGMDVEGEGEGEGEGVGAEKENAAPKKKRASRQVDELLAVLAALDLTDEFTATCEAYAAKLVDKRRFGEAVAYAVRAADGRRIAEIADRILDEYIEKGQDAFIAHVDSIPTSLLRPPSSAPPSPSSPSDLPALSPSAALAPYTARLTFLARYRDFFALYASGAHLEAAQLLVLLLTSGVAPKRFWAVMLLDSVPLLEATPPLLDSDAIYELLRVTEDLLGPPDVFGALDLLARLGGGGGGTDGAAKQMQVVRAALARGLAACACLE